MIGSKLIRLYDCLNSQELEAFHKWLRSPMHNTDQCIIEMYNYLASRRKLTKVSLQKERVYKFIYKDEDYQDLKLRRLMSKSTRVLEEFVRFWMSKNNDYKSEINLISFLRDRKQLKLAKQEFNRLEKKLEKEDYQDYQFYYNKFYLEEERFELTGTQTRIRETNLQEIFDNLSTAFVLDVLRYACLAASHQNLYKSSYSIHFIREVLKQVNSSPFDQIPAVQLYYNAYLALTEPTNENHFKHLKNLIVEYGQKLPQESMRDLYMIAINYSGRKINTDSRELYLKETFDLYIQGLEDGILIENNQISKFTFKNMISVGLLIEEPNVIEHYIQKYSKYLRPNDYENYFPYAMAKLHFTKGTYDEAMKLLIQVDFDDLLLNLSGKMMLVKIYYEEESFDALYALLNSFSKMLQRKTVMNYHKSNYRNIIYVIRKLISMPVRDEEARERLFEKIHELQPLTEKEWLLEQLDKK